LTSTKNELGNKVSYNSTMDECIERSNIIVITTIEPEFNEISIPDNQNIVIIDCWRILSNKQFSDNVKYHAVGVFQ
ncbi:MAG: hypothetical protein ABGY11_11340, partial [Candidatus Thioglobus sp.]